MIITFEDIRKVRPIAENLKDEKRLEPYIRESEEFYLKPLISPKLYNEIESKKDEFIDLLDGCVYDNERKQHIGLREAMGYLVYSRFVRLQSVNVTAFGVVVKKTDFSTPADDKTVVRVANDAEKIGLAYLDQCIEYMKHKGWLDSCKEVRKKRKFKAIGL